MELNLTKDNIDSVWNLALSGGNVGDMIENLKPGEFYVFQTPDEKHGVIKGNSINGSDKNSFITISTKIKT